MKIVCTLSGGEYKPSYVQSLARQCMQHAPEHEFICITPLEVPGVSVLAPTGLRPWNHWWIEMEMFRPDLTGPIMYMDIDTVIHASLADIFAQTELTVLRDAYRGQTNRKAIQDSLMYLPEDVRRPIWEDWLLHWDKHMRRTGAMQAMFQDHWKDTAKFWQDVLPGQVGSYKVDRRADMGNRRLTYFHGKPRPWETREYGYLYT